MHIMREGEALAFEVVYERHADAAFSLAYRMCGRRSMAEDVVQEAFLSLWRSGARYDRTRGSVRTWVLGIVHNRAIDALRRGGVHERRRASDEGIEERFEAPERTELEVSRRDEAREVREALEEPARGTESGHRAGLLRRLHPHGDRAYARHSDRHDQGTHAPGTSEAAADARHGGGSFVSSQWHEHEPLHQVAPYLLHALDDEEVADFRLHLDGCAICRRELAELRPMVDLLPSAAPPRAAPPELGERLMAVVRGEAELLRAAGAGADRAPARARIRWRLRPLAGLAAAATLAIGVAVGLALGGGGVGVHQTRATVAATGAQRGPASGRHARRAGRVGHARTSQRTHLPAVGAALGERPDAHRRPVRGQPLRRRGR